jgi:hypothetical protein
LSKADILRSMLHCVDQLLTANTTAFGRETRRASSDPACNRWETA